MSNKSLLDFRYRLIYFAKHILKEHHMLNLQQQLYSMLSLVQSVHTITDELLLHLAYGRQSHHEFCSAKLLTRQKPNSRKARRVEASWHLNNLYFTMSTSLQAQPTANIYTPKGVLYIHTGLRQMPLYTHPCLKHRHHKQCTKSFSQKLTVM